MKVIQPKDQPTPKGHYSPGFEHNGLIFVSGQLPMDLETREPFTGAIEGQAELALRNVEAVLKAAGFDVKIQHPEVVSKSFPAFWRTLGWTP